MDKQHGANTSTPQEIIRNEQIHANENNINSYVSFQNNGDHVCGGVRVAFDQVLTLKICFGKIREHYFGISALIPALSNKVYEIVGYKELTNKKFFIIMVSSTTPNLRFLIFYIVLI